MDNHHAHHAAETAQNTQYRAASGLVDLIEGLLKAYKDKRKNEHRIEVKVDGKTKFKATIDKNGHMKATKNDLSPDEIRALQNYFKSMPNPPINPKDFDVNVDGQTVLSTRNGNVVKQSQSQRPDAFAETNAGVAPSPTADPSPPSTTTKAAPLADQPKTEPTPVEKTDIEPVTPKAQAIQGRLDLDAEKASQNATHSPAAPITTDPSEPLPNSPKETQPLTSKPPSRPEASPVSTPPVDKQGSLNIPSEAVTSQSADQPPSATAVVPTVNDAGLIPADYGLSKNISDEAIVASGDRLLVASHGSLEGKRLELNDTLTRLKDPKIAKLSNTSHLSDRVDVLRKEINAELPAFAERLDKSIKAGKYNPAQRTAPGLDNDMTLTPKKQETKKQSKQRTPVKA
jgi:cytochrome c553